MRGIQAAVVIVFATLAASAGEEKKYISKVGRFAVAYPAGAEVKSTRQMAGGLTMHMTTAEARDKAYSVMYMLLPGNGQNVPAKAILDGAEKGMIEKSGGKLLKSKDIEFGTRKFPGREVLAEKDGNKVRTWIIVAGTRVYVVLVTGPTDYATGKDAQAFLDSFEITK